jgi:hypothetical protein
LPFGERRDCLAALCTKSRKEKGRSRLQAERQVHRLSFVEPSEVTIGLGDFKHKGRRDDFGSVYREIPHKICKGGARNFRINLRKGDIFSSWSAVPNIRRALLLIDIRHRECLNSTRRLPGSRRMAQTAGSEDIPCQVEPHS